jgi:hypothetical protein
MKPSIAISLFVGAILSANAEDKFICPITKPTPITFHPPGSFGASAIYDLSHEKERTDLKITGRRLDAESAPLEFEGAHTAWIDSEKYFITSGFYLPALGCWEITGHFHGTDLTITVDLS